MNVTLELKLMQSRPACTALPSHLPVDHRPCLYCILQAVAERMPGLAQREDMIVQEKLRVRVKKRVLLSL